MAGPGMGGRRAVPGAKPANIRGTFKRVFSYMSEYKVTFVFVVIAIVLSSLAQVAGTSMLRKVIDNYIDPMIASGRTNELMAGLIRTIIIMGSLFALSAACVYFYSRTMVSVSTKTLCKIRSELFEKMERLPIRYFDTHTHGELMSRYTNDTDTLREMLSNSVTNFISSIITVTSTFVMMIINSWQLTLLVILMLFVMLRVVAVVGGKSGTYFREQQKELGTVNGYIEEYIDGQRVVKVFNHEETTKKDFGALAEQLCGAATRANTYANILMPIMGNLSHALYALTAAFGGALAFAGVLSIGTVVLFLQYTRSFSQPITQMSQQVNNVLTALAGAERIFAMIDEPAENDDGDVTLVDVTVAEDGTMSESPRRTGKWAWKEPTADGGYRYIPVRGRVEFDDVTFAYVEGKTVLNDVSLYANPGQKIAFVGSTGAGKTTITNLINRFYDVPDGKIRYDGININRIRKSDLRRSLSMVLQDTHLFTGTVRENIRYGRLDATNLEVIAAARLANADSFIRHLPHGYDTMLTDDGASLSQGQRQLLSIARAAVADPPVLILDEATSSIDTRTEKLIEQGMDHLMEGRTVFVIAHRLSTVRNSNAIMVLEHGRIIERGDHDDLIAMKGKYYQLYTGMFELE